eukprot:TRINITY_DN1451_c5_g1_i1.p1 TRINITY_DN1451_c5_g1~~TRINITY_DN1451_c5_g1_i1.p1  ORF type:complete len:134 (+),score=24.86 TRINITY_DN1451_c5_g1_i1:60-404(+)
MLRRSVIRLGGGSGVAGIPKAPLPENGRLGDEPLSGLGYVRTFVDPTFHIERLAKIEEEIDGTKTRKWIIALLVLGYPLYFVFNIGNLVRYPSPKKIDGCVPEPVWNDEEAGKI